MSSTAVEGEFEKIRQENEMLQQYLSVQRNVTRQLHSGGGYVGPCGSQSDHKYALKSAEEAISRHRQQTTLHEHHPEVKVYTPIATINRLFVHGECCVGDRLTAHYNGLGDIARVTVDWYKCDPGKERQYDEHKQLISKDTEQLDLTADLEDYLIAVEATPWTHTNTQGLTKTAFAQYTIKQPPAPVTLTIEGECIEGSTIWLTVTPNGNSWSVDQLDEQACTIKWSHSNNNNSDDKEELLTSDLHSMSYELRFADVGRKVRVSFTGVTKEGHIINNTPIVIYTDIVKPVTGMTHIPQQDTLTDFSRSVDYDHSMADIVGYRDDNLQQPIWALEVPVAPTTTPKSESGSDVATFTQRSSVYTDASESPVAIHHPPLHFSDSDDQSQQSGQWFASRGTLGYDGIVQQVEGVPSLESLQSVISSADQTQGADGCSVVSSVSTTSILQRVTMFSHRPNTKPNSAGRLYNVEHIIPKPPPDPLNYNEEPTPVFVSSKSMAPPSSPIDGVFTHSPGTNAYRPVFEAPMTPPHIPQPTASIRSSARDTETIINLGSADTTPRSVQSARSNRREPDYIPTDQTPPPINENVLNSASFPYIQRK